MYNVSSMHCYGASKARDTEGCLGALLGEDGHRDGDAHKHATPVSGELGSFFFESRQIRARHHALMLVGDDRPGKAVDDNELRRLPPQRQNVRLTKQSSGISWQTLLSGSRDLSWRDVILDQKGKKRTFPVR